MQRVLRGSLTAALVGHQHTSDRRHQGQSPRACASWQLSYLLLSLKERKEWGEEEDEGRRDTDGEM